jgi:glycosyltransferase involved in cell wall biosynthesis
MNLEPLVSVVIPTYRRPELVKRAVLSVLAQTLQEIEAIVVIDGPEPNTRALLAEIDDSRLKVMELSVNQGCCKARNAGICEASAQWIAFLDDDDEWLPRKLELQLEMAQRSQYKFPIVTCYLQAQTIQGECVWPRRIPQPSEHLSEYLFVRNSLFQGEGVIQASTIFTSKDLLQRVPYINSLQRDVHEDWDWLLKAFATEGVGVEFVSEVASIWHLEDLRPSLSKNKNWQCSLKWIHVQRHLVTRRAFSSFVLAEVSAKAAAGRNWKAFIPLLWEAFRFGKPQPMDILLYLATWFISRNVRGWVRILFSKKSDGKSIECSSQSSKQSQNNEEISTVAILQAKT